MADLRTYTGYLTLDAIGAATLAVTDTFTLPADAEALDIVIQDGDAQLEGDTVVQQESADPEGDQIGFIADGNGDVLVDGDQIYVESSFTFTLDGAGSFTGYVIETEDSGQSFIVLPPNVTAGTIAVTAVDESVASVTYGPDLGSGDESINQNDFADLDLSGADTIDGGDGDDTIDAGAGDDSVTGGDGADVIVGNAGGDTVDGGAGNDSIRGDSGEVGVDVVRESFNWAQLGLTNGESIPNNANGIDQDTGNITVNLDFEELDRFSDFEFRDGSSGANGTPQNVSGIDTGGEAIGNNVGLLAGDDTSPAGDTISVALNFSANAAGFEDEVRNVQFRINDVDDATWRDIIEIQAFDADGNAVHVVLTAGQDILLTDTDGVNGFDTAEAINGTGNGQPLDDDNSLLVEIPGPVSQILISYGNLETNGQRVDITDIFFDAVPTAVANAATGDDSLLGGAGDDTIFGEGGEDTIDGGTDNDSIEGGDNDDLLVINDNFGSDTITGGEGGETTGDTLDGGALTQAVNVQYTGDEAADLTNAATGDAGEFSEIEHINTGSGDDTIDGTLDTVGIDLNAGAGADTIQGGQAADTLNAGSGDDTIDGQAGDDTINAGDGDDEIQLSAGFDNDSIVGGEGGETTGDTVSGATLTENVVVTYDGDESGNFVGQTSGDNASFDQIEGVTTGSGADTVNASADSTGQIITTNAGNDSITGGTGGDTIDAGANNDIVDGGAGADSILGGAGNDSVLGGAGADTINAGTGTDTIDGGEGADIIDGSNGFDLINLTGNFGDDTIAGGEAGNDGDTLNGGSLTENINVLFDGDESGNFTGQTTGSDAQFSEIEVINTGSGDDTVDASADSVGTTVNTGAGADTVLGGAGGDTLNTGAGDDTVNGAAGADSISAGEGDDDILLTDGFGNDTIAGGEGGETDGDEIDASAVTEALDVTFDGDEQGAITGDTTGDAANFSEIEEITTGSGDDTVDATADTVGVNVTTGAGADTVLGGQGGDTLTTGTGADTINGGAGADSINAGDDADAIQLADGFGDDTILGGEGGTDADTLDGSALTEDVAVTFTDDEAGAVTNPGGDSAGFDEIEAVVTGSGDDTIDASASTGGVNVATGAGADTITGGAGADTIVAGQGADTIDGGEGDDSLTGGDGDDVFVYNQGDGADTIADFNTGNTGALGDGDQTNNDFIDLSAFYTDLNEARADLEDDGILNQSVGEFGDNTDLDGGSINLPGVTVDTLTQDNTNLGLNGDFPHIVQGADGGAGVNQDGDNSFDDGRFYVEFIDNTGPATELADLGFDTLDGSLGGATVYSGGTTDNLNVAAQTGTFGNDTEEFGARITTTLDVTTGGVYTFTTTSDDGSMLFIDGVRVVNNDGVQSETTESGSIELAAGEYEVTVLYFEATGGQSLDATIEGPDYPTAVSLNDASVTLQANFGDETVSGGAGQDTFQAGEGDDSLSGGADQDTFVLEDGFDSDTIVGGEGGTDDDVIDQSALSAPVNVVFDGSESGTTTDGADTATFTEIETIIGTGLDDTIDASLSNSSQTLQGGDGGDTITGSTAADSIFGGDGADSILDGSGDDTVFGGAGDDTIGDPAGQSSAANDSLFGGEGSDSIYIGNGQDTAFGGDDADFIYTEGSNFDKLVEGGEGGLVDDDTLSFATETDAADAVDVTFTTGDPEAGVGVIRGQTVTFSEIENIEGTQVDDTFDASATGPGTGVSVDGQAGDDTFTGGEGDDTLIGGGDADQFNLADSFGDDSITGGEAGTDEDSLAGGALTQDVTVTINADDESGTITNPDGDSAGFAEIEAIETGSGDDTIDASASTGGVDVTTNAGADTITGGAGDDTFSAGSGQDTINGGAGDDIIDAGDDQDTVQLTDGFGDDTIAGGEGGVDEDTLDGGALTENVGVTVNADGESGAVTNPDGDSATFSEIEAIVTGTGDDTVDASASAVGVDVQTGEGADTIAGGAGDDILAAGAGDDMVNGGLGADRVTGGDGDDELQITDQFGDDTIVGGEGGETNGDTLAGGDLTEDVTVTFNNDGESGTVTNPGGDSATFEEIEAVETGSGDDTIDASGSPVGVTVDSGAGDDTITGGTGDDTFAAGAGDDTITAGAGADIITAGDGDDDIQLTDNFGADTIIGGEGDENNGGDEIDASAVTEPVNVLFDGDEQGTITGDTTGDQANFEEIEEITTGAGDDTVNAAADTVGVTINTGAGDDTVLGGQGNDTLNTGTGQDTVNGGAGADSIDAGDDEDTIQLTDSFGDDTIAGGEGGNDADTLDGGALTENVDVTINADGESGAITNPGGDNATFSEIEAINTGSGDDTVDASAANVGVNVDTGAGEDTIAGGAGDDTLAAGAGDDTVDGGLGADSVTGGDGDDELQITDQFGDDTIIGGEGGETNGDTLAGGGLTEDVAVTFNNDGESGTVTNPGGDNATFEEIEAVETGSGDDTIDASGSPVGVNVDAGAGADTITGGTGDDTFAAGAGDDTIDAGLGADSISAGDGDDLITTTDNFGDDTVVGGEGGETNGDTLDGGTITENVVVTFDADEEGTFTGQATGDEIAFSEIEAINTGAGDDTVDATNDTGGVAINTGAGTDTVLGGAGADTLNTGTGADTVNGAGGDDSINAGDDADTIQLTDGFGNDTIAGGEGGVDEDTLDGGALTENVDVTINADGESGTVENGNGDTAGFTEVEAVITGAGDDTVDASAATVGVDVVTGDGADTVSGGLGDDTLDAGAGDDTINGGLGADSVTGGDGDDQLQITDQFGDDTIVGGEGGETNGDTLAGGGLTEDVTVTFNNDGESGTVTNPGGDSATFEEIEAVETGSGDDTIDASGSPVGVNVDAGAGADTITGGSGDDTFAGGAGDDTIAAGEGNDSITAGDGDDDIQLTDNFGDDTIIGGEGDENNGGDEIDASAVTEPVSVLFDGDEQGTITGDTTGDQAEFEEIEAITTGAGDDTVDATADTQGVAINTGDGADTVLGGQGDDTLTTGTGQDTVNGGAGDDSIDAGDDQDLIQLTDGFGDDTISGGAGGVDEDTLDGGALTEDVTVTFNADDESGTIANPGGDSATFADIEAVTTGSGDDTVDGSASTGGIDVDSGAGDDSVTGGAGEDTLETGVGADTVDGGAGDDSITTGDGDDVIGLSDGFGDDTLIAGEGGETNGDTLDGGALTEDVTVTFNANPEDGTVTNAAGDTATFTEVEAVATGAGDDTIDATGAGAGVNVETGAGADSITGSDQDDTLSAGDDDDLIFGGLGDDVLTGGDGDDIFTYNPGDGNDVITDFNVGNTGPLNDGDQTNNDFIDLSEFYTDLNEARADLDDDGILNQSVGDFGDNTLFDGGSITLNGVTPGGLTQDNTNLGLVSDFPHIVQGADGGAGINQDGDNTFDDGRFYVEFVDNTGPTAQLSDLGFDTIDGSLGNSTVVYSGGTTDNLDVTSQLAVFANDETEYGARITTTLEVTAGGTYTFSTTSDDGSILYIDGNPVVLNDGLQSANTESGTIDLDPGLHEITILYFENAGVESLEATIQGPDHPVAVSLNDTAVNLQANFGNETVSGGAGDDTFQAGFGDDNLFGQDDQDTFQLEDGFDSDTIVGGEGGTDIDTLDQSALSAPVNVVYNGDEEGTTSDGTDTALFSEIETQILSAGADTLDASQDNAGTNVFAGAGGDTLLGGSGSDTIRGESGDDTIDGGADGDSLEGGDDQDTFALTDGFGADTIIGGEGGTDNDTLDHSGLSNPVNVVYDGDEQGTTTDSVDTAEFSEIENQILTSGDDTLDATLDTVGINVDAGAGADTLLGGAGDDTIDAGAGQDTIAGAGGDDSILGGDDQDSIQLTDGFGDDTIAGGEGGVDSDTLDGGALTEAVTVTFTPDEESGAVTNPGGDSAGFTEIEAVVTGSGADTIDASAALGGVDVTTNSGADAITGGAGDDTFDAGAGQDTIAGGDGADSISAGDDQDEIQLTDGFGNDTIAGGEGGVDDDTLDGGALTEAVTVTFNADDESGAITNPGGDNAEFSEIEVVETGSGDDTIDGSASTGGVNVITNTGADTITGGAGDDTIDAGVGQDTIAGGAGADSITAGDDEDTVQLTDGFGDDTIDGGAGGVDQDTLDGGALTEAVTVLYDGNESGAVTNPGGDSAGFSDIEAIRTGSGDDTIDATADAVGTDIDSGAGDDTITGGQGDDTIVAGAGDDTIAGGVGTDSIDGGDDDDVIDGGDNTDTIFGGAGNDSITDTGGALSDDIIFGGAGDDTIDGGIREDEIDGGDGDDLINLIGVFGDDTIVGGEAGETNGDTVSGSTLTEDVVVTFSGDEAGDFVSQAGNGSANFVEIEAVETGLGDDTVDATNDTTGVTIITNEGDDVIIGGAGDDSIDGGDDDDTITFGQNDTALGGDGADEFIIQPTTNGMTVIGDFDPSTNVDNDVIYDEDNLPDQTDNDLVDLSGFFDNINDLRDNTIVNGDGDLVLDLGDGQTLTLIGVGDVGLLNFENTNVVCFTRGAMIRTPKGDIAVEDLQIGDMVKTLDSGAQPIRWIGRRVISAGVLDTTPRLRPVRIAAGALGNTRDLLVSPQHRMLLKGTRAEMMFGADEVLASAKDLIDGDRIHMGPADDVEYFHILFDDHEIIFAEDAATESFHPGRQALDTTTARMQAEIFELFPELAEDCDNRPMARMVLKSHEAKAFVRK